MKEKVIRGLINEQVRRVILESEVGNILDKELGSLMSQFAKELPKAQKQTQQKTGEQIQNEAGILLAASIGLALPAVIKMISSFGKKAAEKVNSIMGNKSNLAKGSAEWFGELGETADHLHHLYLKPIEVVVKNVFRVQDPAKAHKIANVIFHAIIAAMLYFSGVGALKAIKSKEISIATLESALSAIKTGELTKFLTDAVSNA
jgi:tetrahydromethanopterin S-methyltransferase subunit G